MIDKGNRFHLRMLLVVLVIRVAMVTLGHFWLHQSTPFHSLNESHGTLLYVSLHDSFRACAFTYLAIYAAGIVAFGVLYARLNRLVDSRTYNELLYSVIQVCVFALLLVDLLALHIWESGTEGPLSPLRVLNFVLISICTFTINSVPIVASYFALQLFSFFLLYAKSEFWPARPTDLFLILAPYVFLQFFLLVYRRDRRMSFEKTGPGSP